MWFTRPKVDVCDAAFTIRSQVIARGRAEAVSGLVRVSGLNSGARDWDLWCAVDGWICDLVLLQGLTRRLVNSGPRLRSEAVGKGAIMGLMLAYDQSGTPGGAQNIESALDCLRDIFSLAAAHQLDRTATIRTMFDHWLSDDADDREQCWEPFVNAVTHQNTFLVPMMNEFVQKHRITA